MASKLEQLRAVTTIVADTGDLEAVARLKPVDCTTNPTIVLKALGTDAFHDVVEEAVMWGRRRGGDSYRVAAETADRLTVSVGVELLRLVPGYVSTEVDANLSFDVSASIAKARQIIAAYEHRGIQRERVLIKLASTWEGIRAADELQREGVKCNMTLLLNRVQAVASAEAGAFLVSPFVGRIYDWHKKSSGRDFAAAEDPGVRSVRDIYDYYKGNGIKTVVMGASFRNTGQIEALAGCDRLTITPALLDALDRDHGYLRRALEVPVNSVDVKHPDLDGAMDEATFRWAMNEDAMATEKLAEGIRVFARDLSALRADLGNRLR